MPAPIISRWIVFFRKYHVLAKCFGGCAGIAVLTFLGVLFKAYPPTMSFLYLLLVVSTAALFGFWPASVTSLVAVTCLDYYFTPPVLTFRIANPQDYVALGSFEITALVISRLSAKQVRNAREAAIRRAEMAQLYELSRSSLLLDLREPPGPQLCVLIQRIFNASAVQIFDINLGRQDRVGDWPSDQENLARECYMHGVGQDNPQSDTAVRVLRAGPGMLGALAVRRSLSPPVVDALAALAAIAINQHRLFENEDRAETARRSEQLRTAVLDALAHELKTPLTALQTASSGLLEFGEMPPRDRELVTMIDESAGRLNELCTRLLVSAKLEIRQAGQPAEQVNVRQVASNVVASRPSEEQKSRLRVLMRDPALTVYADGALLTMMLTHLIENALKYSTPGSPIEIAARMSSTEVLISVHNVGSLIRVEDRERIFDRFYRSPDLKDSIQGTGVGLSVVKKAAESQRGHVWAVSNAEEGTTFYLALPNGARRNH
jgi:two-component system sensor histidine kinase KdpD